MYSLASRNAQHRKCPSPGTFYYGVVVTVFGILLPSCYCYLNCWRRWQLNGKFVCQPWCIVERTFYYGVALTYFYRHVTVNSIFDKDNVWAGSWVSAMMDQWAYILLWSRCDSLWHTFYLHVTVTLIFEEDDNLTGSRVSAMMDQQEYASQWRSHTR